MGTARCGGVCVAAARVVRPGFRGGAGRRPGSGSGCWRYRSSLAAATSASGVGGDRDFESHRSSGHAVRPVVAARRCPTDQGRRTRDGRAGGVRSSEVISWNVGLEQALHDQQLSLWCLPVDRRVLVGVCGFGRATQGGEQPGSGRLGRRAAVGEQIHQRSRPAAGLDAARGASRRLRLFRHDRRQHRQPLRRRHRRVVPAPARRLALDCLPVREVPPRAARSVHPVRREVEPRLLGRHPRPVITCSDTLRQPPSSSSYSANGYVETTTGQGNPLSSSSSAAWSASSWSGR